MITVVTENNTTTSNLFPGMSLAEACSHVRYECAQIINECQMNILLNEHAFLYENGTEIQYVDEAGEDNTNGMNLKEKISQNISKAWTTISGLWDKLINYVTERIDAIVDFMIKRGISRKAFDKAKDIYLTSTTSNGGDTLKLPVIVNFSDFEANFKSLYNEGDFSETENKVWETYADTNGGEVKMTNEAITKAAEFVFNKNTIVSSICAKKKEAEANIKASIKLVKAAKADNMKDTLAQMNTAIKTNSAIARDSVKLYHTHLANCVAIVRKVVSHPDVRKAAAADFKASVKAAPGKVAYAAKEAPGKMAAAAKATKGKFFPTK